jgi:DNA (cytosine-5)-methyltransferase 1
MHHHPVNLVEFCAGYCGIGIGLKSVVRNLRTIAYIEREAYAAANLAGKIEEGRLDAAPIWSDLLDFPYGKFRGLVDIAAAGIPCQPHSHAGLRKGGGRRAIPFWRLAARTPADAAKMHSHRKRRRTAHQ